MFDVFIFITFFYLSLFSVIGYGLIFQSLILKKIINFNEEKVIYLGFYGLSLITLISLITSIVIPHNFTHNILLHSIGITYLIFSKGENKKKYLNLIIVISVLVFSALLISKTNDDFSYYHLPFTKYLTEQKIIFGMGHLNHGYNLLSSLFFLNSTFYLPFIKFYSFHFTLIFFLIFFNFFLIKEIFSKYNHQLVRFLYLFAFIYFNLSFNRLSEYGTDKVGQLLIVVLIIKFFQYSCLEKNKFEIKNILYLLPLLGYCITLKTYFIPYLVLGAMIFLFDNKLSNSVKKIFFSKVFFYFALFLIFYFLHHFISTGCLISPLPSTCFGDIFSWARDKNDIIKLSIWLEQWAKAGAGPNFRVENVSEYIKNLNWVSNWIDKYFVVKFLDQLGIIFSSFILIYFIFKNSKSKVNEKILNKKIFLFYSLILIIFLVWFLKHPTLRYGGYSIVFLVLSFPISYLFYKIKSKEFFEKKFKYIILLVIVIFNIKNIHRIDKEFKRSDIFKFSSFPYFSVKEKEYKKNFFNSGLVIYQAHHCWATPSPCGHVDDNTTVSKKNGYLFINKKK